MPPNVTPLQPLVERRIEGGGVARYEQPAADLRDFITGYHLYTAPRGQPRSDWFLPGTANIRISWYNKPIAVTIGEQCFDPLPAAALFGPTSHALNAKTRGGFMVGIGISALGWARLFDQPARSVADRIVPLQSLWNDRDVADLVTAMQRHDVAEPVAPLLDRFFRPRIERIHRDEALILRLATLLVDESTAGVSDIADMMAIGEARLRRLAYRYFGFAPKRLLRRSRFLRSLIPLLHAETDPARMIIAPDYVDHSHFIREAHEFLGMTPGQFATLHKPFLSASLAARPQVLGASTQALQVLGEQE